jgi:hypothetical protein
MPLRLHVHWRRLAVSYLYINKPDEKKVLWLEVAVSDMQAVQVRNPLQNLPYAPAQGQSSLQLPRPSQASKTRTF